VVGHVPKHDCPKVHHRKCLTREHAPCPSTTRSIFAFETL
jgi:hypothetical protein